MTLKEQVEKLEAIATDAKKAVFPERFWDDVIDVCNIAREAAFHLSETAVDEDCRGAAEHAAGKFLNRWDGRE